MNLSSELIVYRCSSWLTDESRESQPWRGNTLHPIMELPKLIKMEEDTRSNLQTLTDGRHAALLGDR